MGSSEIEIISDSSSKQAPPEPVITDVFGACAYGDLAKLRSFVEKEGGSSLLTQQDGNGFYPLQWAALNNFPDAVHYVLQHGGDVHAVDNVRQTALHWAAVRGSVAAADVLLQNGARVEAVDVNGYRAVHVAA
ncbi:probable protein S-acyltransferase 23, partial [Tanacetum coccineum]